MKHRNEVVELTNKRVEIMHAEHKERQAKEWDILAKDINNDVLKFMDNILSPAIDKAIDDGSYDVVLCISKYNMVQYDTYKHYIHCTLDFEKYSDKMVHAFIDMLNKSLVNDFGYDTSTRFNDSDIMDPKLNSLDDYYTMGVRWSNHDEDFEEYDNSYSSGEWGHA